MRAREERERERKGGRRRRRREEGREGKVERGGMVRNGDKDLESGKWKVERKSGRRRNGER